MKLNLHKMLEKFVNFTMLYILYSVVNFKDISFLFK